jgi:hypothetical protein
MQEALHEIHQHEDTHSDGPEDRPHDNTHYYGHYRAVLEDASKLSEDEVEESDGQFTMSQ